MNDPARYREMILGGRSTERRAFDFEASATRGVRDRYVNPKRKGKVAKVSVFSPTGGLHERR